MAYRRRAAGKGDSGSQAQLVVFRFPEGTDDLEQAQSPLASVRSRAVGLWALPNPWDHGWAFVSSLKLIGLRK